MSIQIRSVSFSPKDNFKLECSNLNFAPGDCVAIVGVNGSGKTSLVESILGLKAGAMCDADINGIHVDKFLANKSRLRNLGFQMQGMSFPYGVKVGEIRKLHHLMYGCVNSELAELLELGRLDAKKYLHCSLGERLRAELYFACAHKPDVLIFDEPTRGLDQLAKTQFLDWVQCWRSDVGNNITLMTSHSVDEIRIANRWLWIKDGKIQFDGGRSSFFEQYLGEYRLDVSALDFEQVQGLDAEPLAYADTRQSVPVQTYFGGEDLRGLASKLLSGGAAIESASVSKTTERDVLDFITRN